MKESAMSNGTDSAATGILVLNKPTGITSRKLVDQVARLLPRSKVGHAGTLDPLATGVLIVCVGAATRLVENVQDLPKSYRTLIRLGARSDTLDADGRIEVEASPTIPSSGEIEQAIAPLLGHGDAAAAGLSRPSRFRARGPTIWRGPARRSNCPLAWCGSTGSPSSTTPGRISSSKSIAGAGPISDRLPATSAMLWVAEGMSRRWFEPAPARSHSSRPSNQRPLSAESIHAHLRPALDAVPDLAAAGARRRSDRGDHPGQAAVDSRPAALS